MIFLKLSFISVKDRANLYTYRSFVLKVQCFHFRRSKGPLVLLSTMDKRIAITFHENQRLNIGNQYQKDAA